MTALAVIGVYVFLSWTNSPDAGSKLTVADEEYERGPHRGRMLRHGNFALEITIFENGVPPEYRVYAYEDNQLIEPKKVSLRISLHRLDGEVNVFKFTPEKDFLRGDGVVTEPHSFDVKVNGSHEGKNYDWEFASYEGRTSIDEKQAEASGILLSKASSALIKETVPMTGRVVLNGNATANIKARFPGVIRSVEKNQNDNVNSGDVMATVESNDSLEVYPMSSPIKGIVFSRNANIGDITNDNTLFVVADLSEIWVEFPIFQNDIPRIKTGQKVIITNTKNSHNTEGTIIALLPHVERGTQTKTARVLIDNKKGLWSPGMIVQGKVIIEEHKVPLAVKSSGLQTFRDFTVVFAKIGNTYEVRMLELGLNDGKYVQVLSGLKPDTPYVSENSFLIKADIEKSGATHDH